MGDRQQAGGGGADQGCGVHAGGANAPRLDWAALMRAGMGPARRGGLGLAPAVFWALTPAELALMLGIEPGGGAMTRGRLAELAARYPDPPPRGRHQQE